MAAAPSAASSAAGARSGRSLHVLHGDEEPPVDAPSSKTCTMLVWPSLRGQLGLVGEHVGECGCSAYSGKISFSTTGARPRDAVGARQINLRHPAATMKSNSVVAPPRCRAAASPAMTRSLRLGKAAPPVVRARPSRWFSRHGIPGCSYLLPPWPWPCPSPGILETAGAAGCSRHRRAAASAPPRRSPRWMEMRNLGQRPICLDGRRGGAAIGQLHVTFWCVSVALGAAPPPPPHQTTGACRPRGPRFGQVARRWPTPSCAGVATAASAPALSSFDRSCTLQAVSPGDTRKRTVRRPDHPAYSTWLPGRPHSQRKGKAGHRSAMPA